MAFRHNDLGRLVAEDPAEASARLTALYEANGRRQTRVAKALGVDRKTLARWLERLEAAGHPVQVRGNKQLQAPEKKQPAA